MSWFNEISDEADRRERASVSEILTCFRNDRSLLVRLAFLITGNEATAEESVKSAREMTLQGHSPFRDWLPEWSKTATIASAISRSVGAIRACEGTYKNQRCTNAERLSSGDSPDYKRDLDVLLESDPGVLIAELDPLSRAVLVLRVAMRSSVQDCALRLNVSRRAVLAANCRAVTWLHDSHLKEISGECSNSL
jgi:hypothetical protein